MRPGQPRPRTAKWSLVVRPPRERPIAWSWPPFGPGGVLVGAHDGAVEDQVLEVRVVRQGREDAVPHALGGPPAEPPEGAVPAAEDLRQVAPRRPGPHDPQHALDEHAVVAAGRAGRLWPPQDEARYPRPPRVVQHQTFDRTQGRPPKAALNHAHAQRGNLSSTLHVSARSRNAKPLISLKAHSRNGLSPRPGDNAESGKTRPCRGLARNPRYNRLESTRKSGVD